MVDASNPSSSETFSARFVMTHKREEIETLQARLLGAVERMQYDQTSQFAIKLALDWRKFKFRAAVFLRLTGSAVKYRL